MKTKKVMIIGLGELGGYILEYLARSAGVTDIIAADYNEDHGSRKTNLVAHGASMMGFFPKIEIAPFGHTAKQ
jgi:prephenate dehydrogenase